MRDINPEMVRAFAAYPDGKTILLLILPDKIPFVF
jgi:hypothetical protein